MDASDSRRFWLEIGTDSEKDWTEALRICCRSFHNSSPFVSRGWNDEKRKRIIEEYFKYTYESELAEGKGGLVCIKTRKENGSIEIVLAAACAYNRMKPTTGNRSTLDAIDVNALKEEDWAEMTIHEKMREASERLNFSHLYGVFIACHTQYLRSGIARRFHDRMLLILREDGVRRGQIDGSKPCIFYGIVDDVKSRRFHSAIATADLAHFHQSESAICMVDADSSKEHSVDCITVRGMELFNADGLCKKISQIYEELPFALPL